MTARLLISAAHKSSGKTTITMGLCAALRVRGRRVHAFKKGPDYIDPMWLAMASGQPCWNLDPWLMGDAGMRAVFAARAATADINIVEGNKGLYDGLDLDGSNSNAAVAHALALPVILVIDARGMTRGVAPLLLGYQAFDRQLNIAGVILNNLGGARHESKLRAVIEHYTDIPVLGAVQYDARLAVDERHLGLMPSNEMAEAAEKVAQVGIIIGAQVDLARIEQIAATAGPLVAVSAASCPEASSDVPTAQPVRIGIARDEAFGFYYAEDLAALRAGGATLVPIDTLRDQTLPPVDGLVIGGGFPEVFMDRLAANHSLRAALRHAIEAGLPTWAECGGLMYLSRSLSWKGRQVEMVGVVPADAVMHARPVGRGYVRLASNASGTWMPAMPGEVRGHEFHYSSLENLHTGTRFAWKMLRGHGVDGCNDGILLHNLVASYVHLRGVDTWVQPLLSAASHHASNKASGCAAAVSQAEVPEEVTDACV